ncbi:MAG: hypothetical protein ABIP94_18555 [Planctomycetota bacterium]
MPVGVCGTGTHALPFQRPMPGSSVVPAAIALNTSTSPSGPISSLVDELVKARGWPDQPVVFV